MSKHDITVSLPCHHPAWPLRCDQCGGQADGFNVTQGIWCAIGNPKTPAYVFSLTGMACRSCHRVVLSGPKGYYPLDVDPEKMKRAVKESAFFRSMAFLRMSWVDFDEKCRTDVVAPASQ